jgi:hypothetical protein
MAFEFRGVCSRIRFHGLQTKQSSFHAHNFDVLVNKQQIENALKPYGLIRNHSQKYQTSKKSTNQKDNTKSLVQF